MGGPPVKKLALAALGAGGRLLWAGARKGAGLVGGAVRHGALYYLTLWAAWRAGELNAKATWNADVLARLDEASPADLKAILGELPPWVHAADWDRVRWLNTLVRLLWRNVNAAASDLVHAQADGLLQAQSASLGKFGIRAVRLAHFSLGAPPVVRGIRAFGSDEDADEESVTVDVDFRLAGDEPNVVVAVELVTGQTMLVQLARLQFGAQVRVRLGPLVPQLPCVGAVSISLIGFPFLDFALEALSGNLMAVPGLDSAVAAAARGAVKGFVWPQRMVVPLIPSDDHYAALLPWPAGCAFVRVIRARDLPVLDLGSAGLSPFCRLHVAGQPLVHETRRCRDTRAPKFDERVVLPVVDAKEQVLVVELWDARPTGDELVGRAQLRLADCKTPALGPDGALASHAVTRTWLPFCGEMSGTTALGGQLAGFLAGRGLPGMQASKPRHSTAHGGIVGDGGIGGGGDGDGSTAAAAGEVLIEVMYVPFDPRKPATTAVELAADAFLAAGHAHAAQAAHDAHAAPQHPAAPTPVPEAAAAPSKAAATSRWKKAAEAARTEANGAAPAAQAAVPAAKAAAPAAKPAAAKEAPKEAAKCGEHTAAVGGDPHGHHEPPDHHHELRSRWQAVYARLQHMRHNDTARRTARDGPAAERRPKAPPAAVAARSSSRWRWPPPSGGRCRRRAC